LDAKDKGRDDYESINFDSAAFIHSQDPWDRQCGKAKTSNQFDRNRLHQSDQGQDFRRAAEAAKNWALARGGRSLVVSG
jgi:hypothetical protein